MNKRNHKRIKKYFKLSEIKAQYLKIPSKQFLEENL